MNFGFQYPLVLLGLFVPLLLALLRHRRPALQVPSLDASLRAVQAPALAAWLPRLLRTLALLALIIALARPQLRDQHTDITAEGIDIVLAVDLSQSMSAMDFATNDDLVTRLDVVKRVLEAFIEARPNDRIGIIGFARDSYLISPLTLNHDWLHQTLKRLELGLIDGRSTAIGPAIGMGANSLRNLEQAQSRVLILLTDGEDTVGTLPPVTAAEAAASYGIRIYTIGAGRPGLVPMARLDNQGRVVRDRQGNAIPFSRMNSAVDEDTLRRIAEVSGGQFFRATNREQLQSVYDEIDQLERTEVELRQQVIYDELYAWPASLGLALLLLEVLLRQTRFQRLP